MDRMDGGIEDVGVWKNVGAVVCASGRRESWDTVLGSRGSIIFARGGQKVVHWVAGECSVRGRKEVSAF
jgi:hypothetical protein